MSRTSSYESLLASHHHCMACGSSNPQSLGLRFQQDRDGWVSARWCGDENCQGYENRVHGGLLAMLLDAAMVHALFMRGVSAVTAELHIRYQHAIPASSEVMIQGRVVSQRQQLSICEAELIAGGRRAVRATAKFMRLADTQTEEGDESR